ncbi:MAG: hypothetical protein JWN69_694 [Alphaproteobacteria bacterium]|nr:hypothetical protein [Alphaproteobacteria bacterium]
MAQEFLKSIVKSMVAIGLVVAPLPALAQTGDATVAEAQGPQGASLWIGILMGAAVLALIFAHNDIFGNNDKPVSP